MGSLVALVVASSVGEVSISFLHVRTWARRFWSGPIVLESLAVFGITLLGFALRATALDRYPPMMHGDEGEMGILALGILNGTQPLSPFSTAFLSHPTMFYFWQGLSMAFFGRNEVGLRMLSALAGTLSIPLLYLLMRYGFGRVAGMASAFLLAVSHLHIQYSRLAQAPIHSSTFALLVVLLLAAARVNSSSLLYSLAGLAAGYSLYFYFGSRAIPLIGGVLLIFLWCERRAKGKDLLLFTLAGWLAISPLLLHYVQHPPALLDRLQAVYLFSPQNIQHTLRQMGGEASTLGILCWQLLRNLRFFVDYGDASSFYLRDLPAFDLGTLLLFWLGMGLALAKPFRFAHAALLVWFWMVVILGGVLTTDAPNAPRLLMAVPTVFAFGGLFVARLFSFCERLSTPLPRILLASFLLLSGVFVFKANYDRYFVEYAQKAPGMIFLTMAREMQREGREYRIYLLGAPHLYSSHGVLRFIAPDAEKVDCLELDGCLSLPSGDKGVIFFIVPQRLEELEIIKARYPQGEYGEAYDNYGRLLYVTYRLPPES
ncbi:MAG: ArnT family glycosyltransferase [Anaerolineae bacterium]